MRRVNVRFLAILAGCVAVLGVAVHLLHAYQVQNYAQGFLREAERVRASGRLQEAAKNLRWYVRLVPDDLDAMAELGVLLADLGQNRQAFIVLEEVLRRDPDEETFQRDSHGGALRRRLVGVALAIRRYSDAREHLEVLLKRSPKDGELLEEFGVCQVALGEYLPAVESYRLAIRSSPDRVDAYRAIADVLRNRLDRAAEADEWMNRLVVANPNVSRAHVVRGVYLKKLGMLEQATAHAAKALALAPRELEALVLAAQCALEKPQYDEARAHAKRAMELYPRRVSLFTLLADIEMRAGSREKAIAWVRQGLKAVPRSAELLWNLANLLVDEGKTAEAEATIQELRGTGHPECLVTYLYTRILYQQEQWLEAARSLERNRAALTAWPDVLKQADFWLGRCSQQLGNADVQLAAYRRAVEVDPFWAPAREGVAMALLSIGRLNEALEEYRQLVRLRNAPKESWIALARMAVLKNLRLSRPDRDWAEVDRLMAKAGEKNPESVQIPILRAETLVAENRVADAEKMLRELRDKRPDDSTLWIALAALAQRQRDWDRTAEILKQAEQRLGDKVALRLARGRYLVGSTGGVAGKALRGLAEKDQKFSSEEQHDLWRGLAPLALQVSDFDQARQLCQKLSREEPHNLRIRLLLFDLALRADDASGMSQLLSEIQGIGGTAALWQYGRAVYLSLLGKKGDKESLSQALKHVSEARVLRPAWARVPLLAAEIYEIQGGREESAIQNYLDAIKLGERNPRAVRRVVELLYRRQRFREADQIIRELEEETIPFSPELGRMAADVSQHLGDFDRALELARQVAQNSKQYRDYIWLGNVLMVTRQRTGGKLAGSEVEKMLSEADKAFQQAVKLADTTSDTWVALIQFLARTSQTQRAEEAIREAQRKIPAGEAPLALAQCYEAIGQLDQAEKKYQAALDAAPDNAAVVRGVADFYLRNGKPRQAEPQLNRMAAGQLKAGEADVLWSRRNLGLLLVVRGGYQNLQQAMEMVNRNLESAESSVEDQRAKALVLASHPKREKQREAIKTFEGIVREQPLAKAEDRFVLAQLYLADGDWANGARQMRSLLASHAEESRYVETYVKALLKRKEVGEAELWLNKLERSAPGRFATVRLRADAMFQRGRFKEAHGLLMKYLNQSDAQPKDRQQRVPLVAGALEDFALRQKQSPPQTPFAGFAQDAEKLYREHAEKQPGQALLLASFLSRQGRLDEALSLTERTWKNASPEMLGEALVGMLSGGVANEEQIKVADKILLAALEKHNRPVPLCLVLADLRSFQGRYAEAEDAYREILKQNSGHVVAMNNLALLMALERKEGNKPLELVSRAIELAGPEPSLLDSRGAVYLALGVPDKAIVDIKEAIAESPTATGSFHLAQAYSQMGDKKSAGIALKKARHLGLTAKTLHPLERPALQAMEKELK